jgi:carbon-monoxide dehydrogenase small subunit
VGRGIGRVARVAAPVAGRASARAAAPAAEARIRLRVNGVEHTRSVEVRKTLADFIREDLSLTGTHLGCEHGVCGACTILMDGEPVRSCLLFAVQADGHDLQTVESLGTPERLSPLQQSFMDHHGLQCGFCTPGFLMTALPIYREAPSMSDAELREALGGQLCRCTGYVGIVEAVRAAAAIEDAAPRGANTSAEP